MWSEEVMVNTKENAISTREHAQEWATVALTDIQLLILAYQDQAIVSI
jgi:hypothetical protein